MSRRVFLIGLDGATFSVLDPLMREGVMPGLGEFVRGGVRADLRSVIPALTPPAWTSLATGRSPGHHGIFDFFTKDSADGPYFHISNAHDVKSETIWSMVNREGLRSTVLNFPLTFPAPEIGGNVVPGWMPWRQLRLGCRPEGLFDRIKNLPGFEAKELSMDLSPEAKAVQGCPPEELSDWVDFYIRRERQWLRIARMLEEEDPSDLTAVLFDGVDKIQHLCWRFIDPGNPDPASFGWERKVRERCLDYYRRLDEILCELFELAGSEATVVIASDHGFGAQTGTFFINAWLEEKGYLAWANDEAPEASDSEGLGIEQLARHVYLLDWDRTRAYVPTPSGNGIYIVRSNDRGSGGVSDSKYAELRARLVDELREVEDDRGEPVVSRVWTRDEVFDGPCRNVAPDITLELADGGLVSILSSKEIFRPRAEPIGAHRAEGVFMACGPGIRRGARLEELSILDVAPTLLHALGLSVPEAFEGAVARSAYEPKWLETHPVERRPSREGAVPLNGETKKTVPALTKEDEKKLAAHLRALGYIE